MVHPEDIDPLNTITEQVLYTVMDADSRISTTDIKDKHEFRDTLVDSQLQELRERGFVSVKKGVPHNRGAVKPPNEYKETEKAELYEEWYRLSVPKYTLRERLDEMEEYLQERTDAHEHYLRQLLTIAEREGYDIEDWSAE